jgi:hypothetical protein
LLLSLDTCCWKVLAGHSSDLQTGHGYVNLICADFVVGQAETKFDGLGFLVVVRVVLNKSGRDRYVPGEVRLQSRWEQGATRQVL